MPSEPATLRRGRGDLFFASPVRWNYAPGHGEAAKRYQVQIDGCEVSCHYEIVSVKSKKHSTRASARQPKNSPGRWQEGGRRNLVKGQSNSH